MSRAAIWVLVLASLSGCAATRVAYNNADWLLRRELIKHTCPTDAQEVWLKGQLDTLHRWHRRSELPRYVKALNGLATALNRPLTRAAMNAFFTELDGARDRFNARLALPAGVYLAGLAQPQVRCVIRQMYKWNQKGIKEMQRADKKYVEGQLEKLEDRLDGFIGDLTAGQKTSVARLIRARKPTHRQMITAWHNWGRRLVARMRKGGVKAAREKRMRAAVQHRLALYTPAERKVARRWQRQNQDMTWAVARLMTADQRKKLRRRLLDLATDLDALARQK